MDNKGAKAASLVIFVYETTADPDVGRSLLLLSESWLAATRIRQEGRNV